MVLRGRPRHRVAAEGGGAPVIALPRLCRRLSNRSLTLAALGWSDPSSPPRGFSRIVLVISVSSFDALSQRPTERATTADHSRIRGSTRTSPHISGSSGGFLGLSTWVMRRKRRCHAEPSRVPPTGLGRPLAAGIERQGSFSFQAAVRAMAQTNPQSSRATATMAT